MADREGIFQVLRDLEPRSAAEQMAIDESLLQSAKSPVIRFYQWADPAITIGHFVSRDSVAALYPGLEIARRRTGGGIVEHGDDVTFALAIPRTEASDHSRFASLLRAAASERYRWIHERLASALRTCGIAAVVSEAESPSEENREPGRCFASPVVSDVIDPVSGRKIAGGAQRRSREGWLHQGSVRLNSPHDRIDADWTLVFCKELAEGLGIKDGSI